MKRMLAALGLVALGMFALRADVGACGDKSLLAGGVRWQRAQAARYPASILIYGQTSSRMSEATRALKLQSALQQVGHQYREVTTGAELRSALASGRYNIVMADVADAADLQMEIKALSSSSRPVIVPVAYKLTKADVAAADRAWPFLVKAPSRSTLYLNTIIDAVRSTGSPSKG